MSTAVAGALMHGALMHGAAYAQVPGQKGCPLEIAVQQVDAFVQKRMLEYAKASDSILGPMAAIVSKASKPGIPIGEQLPAEDLDRLNQLRHLKIQLDAERLAVGNFQRDVHLIRDTYDVAKLADLYETQMESLGDADPRRFYFTILRWLRLAQPRTPRTPLIKSGIDCDPEAGLFFEEEFNQRQLAKAGADQRLVNLIFDIERLRTFYQLSWNMLNKSIDDVRATTWKGDIPSTPDSITPLISTSDAATQAMYRVVIPYIDKQMPSEVELEARFENKRQEQAEQDYPTPQEQAPAATSNTRASESIRPSANAVAAGATVGHGKFKSASRPGSALRQSYLGVNTK